MSRFAHLVGRAKKPLNCAADRGPTIRKVAAAPADGLRAVKSPHHLAHRSPLEGKSRGRPIAAPQQPKLTLYPVAPARRWRKQSGEANEKIKLGEGLGRPSKSY
jgi:hypothetical protein